MGDRARTLVARAANDDEVREVWYQSDGGWLSVGEDTQGALTRLSFGESWHRGVVSLAPDEARRAGLDAEGQVARYFASHDVMLCDLMDELDAAGIPYSYTATGSNGLSVYRPARE